MQEGDGLGGRRRGCGWDRMDGDLSDDITLHPLQGRHVNPSYSIAVHRTPSCRTAPTRAEVATLSVSRGKKPVLPGPCFVWFCMLALLGWLFCSQVNHPAIDDSALGCTQDSDQDSDWPRLGFRIPLSHHLAFFNTGQRYTYMQLLSFLTFLFSFRAVTQISTACIGSRSKRSESSK